MLTRVLGRDASLISDMRFVLVGGGPLPKALADRAVRAGVPVLSTYGMTEATSQIATATTGDRTRLVPLDGVIVTTRSDGRITVDGPTVSPGFLGEKPREGSYVTNDAGRIEPDGGLTVIGRVDDIVISGGENISLGAIGASLSSFEGVSAAAAVGVADPEWGTTVVGIVETDLDSDALDNLARPVLAPYERPRRWVIVDRLPLLANGKPDLAAAREMAEQALS
jgi:O-succinylbenzoic acid--CoA ligase